MRSIQPTARLLIIILWLFSAAYASGQSVNQSAFHNRQDSLQHDFSILRSSLQQNYPSLYRYTSKKKMDALLDSCYASIQNTTTNVDFFGMLKFLVSQLKDGHLSCSPSRQLRQYLSTQKAYVPFRLRFINNKSFIYSAANNSLPPATEILAINNEPIHLIKARLFRYIVSDGEIKTKKNYVLGNYFYIYYFLGFGPQCHFDIRYKTENGSINTKRMEAILDKELPPIQADSNNNKLLNLTVTPDHIAILTIQTFDKGAQEEAGLNFEEFLRTSFSSIKDQQIKKLVIDLRGNGGGRDLYGSLLYSYLSRTKFHYYKSLIAAINQLPFDEFKRPITSFNDVTPALLERHTPETTN